MKQIEELKQRFAQLTDREQKLVLLSSVVIVIGAIYFLIYAPMQASIERNRASLNSQKELLTWVTQNANRAVQLKQSGGQGDQFSGSLPQAVNQTANSSDITISRMQPQGDDIQIWVDNARFDNVLNWLQSLEKMGVQIIEADIAEGDSPGIVKIRRLRLSKL
ncbi:type II secretion system protein GspM [Planctobacterium marinum]|uniref:Type II secretion system protein M n=1 Tax=Planctobacterium marinum TaxID=1631968 RepID=A0AA48I295_9ALTE|nr:type II secretion system protein M [Planctobacterium marinum]